MVSDGRAAVLRPGDGQGRSPSIHSQNGHVVGTFAIAWTARGAVACWAARFLLPAAGRDRVPLTRDATISLLGWLLLVAHTLCAFHFAHHWCHAAAYEHTARRTLETVGRHWGGGLYANYATIAVWAVDLAMLFNAQRRGRTVPRWWRWTADALIGFMILNATVVFGPRGWRWAAAVAIGIALFQNWRRRRVASPAAANDRPEHRPPPL